MAENQPATKQPYGPGMLMIFGLFLLALAGWCASDFLGFSERGQEAWKNSEWAFLLFNGSGFVGGIGLAIYAWILAAIREERHRHADRRPRPCGEPAEGILTRPPEQLPPLETAGHFV